MPRLTLPELHRHPDYLRLTWKQRLFIDAYVTNGFNAQAAAEVSYHCKNKNTAGAQAGQALAKPGIILVLAVFFGDSPEKQYTDRLWRMIVRGKITKEQLQAMKVYARLRGFNKVIQIAEEGGRPASDSPTPPSGVQPKRILDDFE